MGPNSGSKEIKISGNKNLRKQVAWRYINLKIWKYFTGNWNTTFAIINNKKWVTSSVMCILHRRLIQLNNLYVVLGVLLAIGFIIQVKILYHNHQRNLRLADYSERLNDLSYQMKAVMKVSNSTSILMRRLQLTLHAKRPHHASWQ